MIHPTDRLDKGSPKRLVFGLLKSYIYLAFKLIFICQ